MAEPSKPARKGDLALMHTREPGIFAINPALSTPARTGYCFAIVTSAKRDGLVKTAERNHETANWPWNLTGQAHSVGSADAVGDVARCVRELPELYATPAAAIEALRKWVADAKAEAI